MLQVTDANGNPDYIRDPDGNVVKSHLNETLLRQIAGATGGFYLPLRGANTMDTLYERGLAPLPKSEAQERLVRRYHEQFHWPLAAAILLLLAEMFLPERKRQSEVQRPTCRPCQERRRGPASALVIVALLVLRMARQASPSSRVARLPRGQLHERAAGI